MTNLKLHLLPLLFILINQPILFGQELENRFIPESAFALIDIDVEQIKKQFINDEGQFVSEYFPAEMVTTMGETYLGFDYMALRRIRIVVAEGQESLGDMRVGLVYQFDKAVDIETKFGGEDAVLEIDDVPVYADMDFGLECLQLDETTVLHATTDFMQELVNARNVTTPLTKLLDASTSKDSEILGVMSFEQIKESYAELVSEYPLPNPVNFLNGAHNLLNSAEFRVSNHMMTLDMLSDDEKSAAKLRMVAKRLIGLAKESAKGNFAGTFDGGDPVSESMEIYLNRIIDSIAAELAPVQTGDQVTMKIKTDAAWVSLLFPMFFGIF